MRRVPTWLRTGVCSGMLVMRMVVPAMADEQAVYPVREGTYERMRIMVARCAEGKQFYEERLDEEEGATFVPYLWLKRNLDTVESYLVGIRAMLLMEFSHAQKGQQDRRALGVIMKSVSSLRAFDEMLIADIDQKLAGDAIPALREHYEKQRAFLNEMNTLLDTLYDDLYAAGER